MCSEHWGVSPVIIKIDDYRDFQVLKFDDGLTCFRSAEEQFAALTSLLADGDGFIFVALDGTLIVGYAAFQTPEPHSYYFGQGILELGAVEVSPKYRGKGIGKKIFAAIKEEPIFEEYITIATEYYWHWDLKNTGLTVWDYRKMLERLFAIGGFRPVSTDDPDILSHPANVLMVRYGKNVPIKAIEAFDSIRIKNYWMI